MSSRMSFLKAAISSNSTGDVTVIAADAVNPLVIWRLGFTFDGATNLTIKEGSTAVSGAYINSGAGSWTQPYDGAPLYVCPPGSAFVINQSGTANLRGTVWYTKG